MSYSYCEACGRQLDDMDGDSYCTSCEQVIKQRTRQLMRERGPSASHDSCWKRAVEDRKAFFRQIYEGEAKR